MGHTEDGTSRGDSRACIVDVEGVHGWKQSHRFQFPQVRMYEVDSWAACLSDRVSLEALRRLQRTTANTGVGSGNGYFGRSAEQAPEIQIDRGRCPQRGGRSAYVYREGLDSRETVAVIRKVASKQDVVEGLRGLTDADLRRLEGIARVRAVGLHEVEWQDLLHEAVVRTLDGARQWPTDVGLVVFLRETMRSIASEHWRRRRIDPIVPDSRLRDPPEDVEATVLDSVVDSTADPERDAAAAETIAQIEKAFQGDLEALHVLWGMALGISPSEIQDEGHMDARRYASTQRRIRRTLAKVFPDRGETQ